MERERLLERLRVRLETLEKLELREPEDPLRASLLLRRVWEEVTSYAARARRYELFDALRQIEGSERTLYATYLTVRLNGGGKEVIERARKDLKEAIKALREILARL